MINEWYDRKSLALNNSFDGPTVQQTRREMLAFFPGCVGMTTEQASARPAGQKCTFVFKDWLCAALDEVITGKLQLLSICSSLG